MAQSKTVESVIAGMGDANNMHLVVGSIYELRLSLMLQMIEAMHRLHNPLTTVMVFSRPAGRRVTKLVPGPSVHLLDSTCANLLNTVCTLLTQSDQAASLQGKRHASLLFIEDMDWPLFVMMWYPLTHAKGWNCSVVCSSLCSPAGLRSSDWYWLLNDLLDHQYADFLEADTIPKLKAACPARCDKQSMHDQCVRSIANVTTFPSDLCSVVTGYAVNGMSALAVRNSGVTHLRLCQQTHLAHTCNRLPYHCSDCNVVHLPDDY